MEQRHPDQAHAQGMFERVERFLVSGLSQSEFCRQEGLGYHPFRYWFKKYQLKEARPSPATETPADFIPLRVVPAEPTAPSPACVIEYPSGIIVRLLVAPLPFWSPTQFKINEKYVDKNEIRY